jgi:SAM-dependent methyltransferase
MTDTVDQPLDWDAFWAAAPASARDTARPGRFAKPDQFRRFFEARSVPATVGSVGCGPADAEFELARRYPDTVFHCYDAAESVIAENRAKAASDGLDNVSFGVAALPDPDIDRQFDLVYCYATLTYVCDIERAIQCLYDLVREGGHLVFDYPNRHTRATYRELLPGEVPEEGRFEERWSLVLDGENLLSHERIHDVLGTWPRSFYAEIDREDPPRDSPCVFVPK